MSVADGSPQQEQAFWYEMIDTLQHMGRSSKKSSLRLLHLKMVGGYCILDIKNCELWFLRFRFHSLNREYCLCEVQLRMYSSPWSP